VKKYEGLIKESGMEGCFVTREEKERYDDAKQCE